MYEKVRGYHKKNALPTGLIQALKGQRKSEYIARLLDQIAGLSRAETTAGQVTAAGYIVYAAYELSVELGVNIDRIFDIIHDCYMNGGDGFADKIADELDRQKRAVANTHGHIDKHGALPECGICRRVPGSRQHQLAPISRGRKACLVCIKDQAGFVKPGDAVAVLDPDNLYAPPRPGVVVSANDRPYNSPGEFCITVNFERDRDIATVWAGYCLSGDFLKGE